LTPFVLVYSWFVCLVFAQWIRLGGLLETLRHVRYCRDVHYHANMFPFLRPQQEQEQEQEQKSQLLGEEQLQAQAGVQPGDVGCRSSGSIELRVSVSSTSSSARSEEEGGDRSRSSSRSSSMLMTTEAISTRYYEELAICLAFSKCCGKWLLFFTLFSLVFAIGVVWALYLSLYHAAGVIAFLAISMIQIFELGFCLSSCNEAGHLVCREVCSYLLAESVHSRQESNSYQEATFLLGCIDHAKLEITYFGNFCLRSRTLLAILGSIVGAVVPGLILSS
jgi:hypothetical protein